MIKSRNQLQQAALKNHTRPGVDAAVAVVSQNSTAFFQITRPENGTEGLSRWKTCFCFTSDWLWQKLTSSPTYSVIDRRFVLHLPVFFLFFFFFFEKACSFPTFSISGLFYLPDARNKFTRLEKRSIWCVSLTLTLTLAIKKWSKGQWNAPLPKCVSILSATAKRSSPVSHRRASGTVIVGS